MIRHIKRFASAFSNAKSQLPEGVSINFDAYKGMHVKLANLLSKGDFEQLMNNLVSDRQKSTSAIWVHLSAENLQYVPYLLSSHSFKIHNGKGDKISVYRWLRQELEDLVVPYSMFYVACGGVIIKDQKIFLIQEKKGDRKGQFGLPGGRANFGEDIGNCAKREVFQQTGITSNFKRILTIRELSNYTYGSFDLYCACLMQLNNQSLSNIKLCNEEVQSYKWVPLSELKEFISTRAIGTQLHINNYIADLYEKGFNFQGTLTQKDERWKSMEYISKRDGIPRLFVEHWFVNPENDRILSKK